MIRKDVLHSSGHSQAERFGFADGELVSRTQQAVVRSPHVTGVLVFPEAAIHFSIWAYAFSSMAGNSSIAVSAWYDCVLDWWSAILMRILLLSGHTPIPKMLPASSTIRALRTSSSRYFVQMVRPWALAQGSRMGSSSSYFILASNDCQERRRSRTFAGVVSLY